jgi:hypothetical protein
LVAALKGDEFRLGFGELFQVGYDARPPELVVVPLVLIRLQATITSGLAVRVIQVVQRTACYLMDITRYATDIPASTDAGIDKGQRDALERTRITFLLPGAFRLKFDLTAVEQQMMPDSNPQR